MKVNKYKKLLTEYFNKKSRAKKKSSLATDKPDSVSLSDGKFESDQSTILSKKYLREKFNHTPMKISLDLNGEKVEKDIRGTENDEELTLNFKHTNDLHGNMPSVASLIEPDEFWIDGGDTWQAYDFHSSLFRGCQEVEMMNKKDCDLAIPGNHFYDDRGVDGAKATVKRSKFPYLSANTNLDGFSPYTIAEIGGIQIGFIGIQCPDKVSPMADPGKVKDLQISDPLEAAKKTVAELKAKGIKNIIAITHLGLENKDDRNYAKDMDIARKVDGIDLILGAHSHTPTQDKVEVNGTRIIHAGLDEHMNVKHSGLFLGDLYITFDKKTQKIKSIQDRLIEVDRSLPLDEDIQDIRAKFTIGERVAREKKIGFLAHDLEYKLNSPEDSPLGNMVADSVREKTGADVALISSFFFIPPWMLKTDITGYADGKVRLKSGLVSNSFLQRAAAGMGKVQDMYVETSEVSGKCIKNILEKGITKLQDPSSGEGLYQVSGLKMVYDPNRPEGNRIKELYIGNEPYKPDKNYKISTTGSESLSNPLLKERDESKVVGAKNKIRHIVANYISDGKTNKYPEGGRIKTCK